MSSGIFLFADLMGKAELLRLACGVLAVSCVTLVIADDPYRFYTWTVTYGTSSPMGVPQQVGWLKLLFISFSGDVWGYVVLVQGKRSEFRHKLRLSCPLSFRVLKVILINGQFPGPRLDVVTNDNIVLNLINKLDQPFLLTWWVPHPQKSVWFSSYGRLDLTFCQVGSCHMLL